MRRWVTERAKQRGMASIIITMITMVIITLIVLGFATLSRREQRQSLDRQLSTQASMPPKAASRMPAASLNPA